MEECQLRENCRNYTYEKDKCWLCEDYKLYDPEDKKILSPRQIRLREERKAQRKEQKNTEASKRGRRSKKKGWQGENEVVKLMQKYGIEAERVPLSGALKGELSCDVVLKKIDKRIEVKRRKNGLKIIQSWLNEDGKSNYILFREDYGDWVAIMPIEEFVELIQNRG